MTAAQQPATTTLPIFGAVTRSQIVHVIKMICAAIPAIVAATVPGLSNDINIALNIVTGLLGAGEFIGHGASRL